MIKKSFFTTFFFTFTFGIIVWTASWWMYAIFMGIVHAPGWSEYILITIIIKSCIFLALMYLVIQAIILKQKKYSYSKVAWRLFLSFIGFCVVGLLLIRNQNAEGIYIVFVFILALISRLVVSEFSLKKYFVNWLLAWFIIICVDEAIQCFLPFRDGSIWDIVNSMIGVLIALLISYT